MFRLEVTRSFGGSTGKPGRHMHEGPVQRAVNPARAHEHNVHALLPSVKIADDFQSLLRPGLHNEMIILFQKRNCGFFPEWNMIDPQTPIGVHRAHQHYAGHVVQARRFQDVEEPADPELDIPARSQRFWRMPREVYDDPRTIFRGNGHNGEWVGHIYLFDMDTSSFDLARQQERQIISGKGSDDDPFASGQQSLCYMLSDETGPAENEDHGTAPIRFILCCYFQLNFGLPAMADFGNRGDHARAPLANSIGSGPLDGKTSPDQAI